MPRREPPGALRNADLGVVVVGMHRTGTSAIAGALRDAGLHAGDESDLHGPSLDNPAGYAERRDLVALDDRLLARLGWGWDTPDPDPRPLPSLPADLIAEGRRLIKALAAPESWFIKDPRIALLLPWWRRILLDRFVAVVTVRSPQEVAWSLAIRDEFPVELGWALANAYQRHLAWGLDGLPVVLVDYAALTTDPAAVMRAVAGGLETVGVTVAFDIDAAIASIRPGLRRATQPDFAAQARDLPTSVVKMASRWQVEQVQLFDRFHLEVDDAEPWENSALEAHRRVRAIEQRASDEHTANEGVVIELERTRGDAIELRAHGEELRTQLAAMATEVEQRDAQLAAITAELRQRGIEGEHALEEAVELRTQTVELRTQSEELRTQSEELRTQMAAMATEVEQRDAQLAAITAELRQRGIEGEHALEEAVELRTQTAELRTQSEELRTQLAAMTTEVEQRDAQIALARDDAVEMRRQRDELGVQMAPLNALLSTLGRAVEDFRAIDERQRVRIRELESALARRSTELTVLQADLGALRSQMAIMEDERGQLKRSAGDLNAQLAAVRSDLDERQRQFANQLGAIRAERDDLLGQLEVSSAPDRLVPHRSLRVRVRRSLYRLPFLHRVWPSPLFDRSWYLATYPDVAAAHMNAYFHWRRHGISERRNPNALFDTNWYLTQYSDVAARAADPLDHYLRFGEDEGLDPGPGFATVWYLAQNPDVARSALHPLLHYLRYGRAEGRAPRPSRSLAAAQPQPPDGQMKSVPAATAKAASPVGKQDLSAAFAKAGNGNGSRSRNPREIIRRLPSGARVVVAGSPDTDGAIAERLVAPLSRERGGSYLGIDPQSALTAIAQVEGARSEGFEYFVLPAAQAWWFEHFPELRSHLDRRYRREIDVEGGVAWRLGQASPWRAVDDLLARISTGDKDPTILDWHTRTDAASIFAGYRVFLPPSDDKDLPYLDDSVDVVLAPPLDEGQLHEAQRVARRGVVIVERAPNSSALRLSLQPRGRAPDLPPLSVILSGTNEHPVDLSQLDWLSEIAQRVGTLEVIIAGAHLSKGSDPDGRPHNVNVVVLDSPDRQPPLRQALAMAKGDLVAHLGADTWPIAGWYEAAALTFRRTNGVGAIAGLLLHPDGSVAANGSRNGVTLRVAQARSVDHASASFAVIQRGAVAALTVDDGIDMRIDGQSIRFEPDVLAVKAWPSAS